MASGVNIKANTNVPEEADTLLVFGLVLLVLALGIIWIIKALSGALIGVGKAAADLPGEVASGAGSGIKSGLGGLGAGINSFFSNLFSSGDS